jgi:hypothetical protein
MMELDANICNPETSSSAIHNIHTYIPGGKKKKEKRKRKNITKQNKQTYKLQTTRKEELEKEIKEGSKQSCRNYKQA